MINTIEMNTWWYYYNQYKTLVDKLINEDKGLINDNLITLPFLNCMRQTLELGLKASILDLSSDRKIISNLNHDLFKLFEIFKELILSAINNAEVIEEQKQKLNRNINLLDNLISYFILLDKYSQNFRYPTDKQDRPSFDAISQIDEDNNLRIYKITTNLLSHVTSLFCDKCLFHYEDDEFHFTDNDEIF